MNYPNKTFVLETVKDVGFGGHQANQLVIVVADSKETATQHLKDKLNFKGVANELTWLMGCDHPTIYDQTGRKPLEIQAKIMYNTSTIIGSY